jgi:hypothetical protein
MYTIQYKRTQTCERWVLNVHGVQIQGLELTGVSTVSCLKAHPQSTGFLQIDALAGGGLGGFAPEGLGNA